MKQSLKKKYFSKKLAMDVLMQMVFPYPGYESLVFMPCLANSGHKYVCYFSSDLVMIFMISRIYGILRHIERYHSFTDMQSKKICRNHGFDSGRMFTIKCELYYHQAASIGYLFVFSVLILAFVLRAFEIPFDIKGDVKNVQMIDYGTAIWLTIITFTTVGYGDFYAHTLLG